MVGGDHRTGREWPESQASCSVWMLLNENGRDCFAKQVNRVLYVQRVAMNDFVGPWKRDHDSDLVVLKQWWCGGGGGQRGGQGGQRAVKKEEKKQHRFIVYLLVVEYTEFGTFRDLRILNTKSSLKSKIIPYNINSCVHQHETSRLRHHTCPKSKNFTVNAAFSKQ